MADEVKFDIDGDPSGAERAYKKVIKENETLKQKLAEVGKTGKKAGEDVKSGFDSAVKSLKDNLSTASLFGAAVGATAKLYGDWAREIDRVKQAHKDLHTEIVKTLGASNDLRNAGAIDKALSKIPNLSPADAAKAFAASTAASPGMHFQRKVDIVGQLAPLAHLQDIAPTSNLAAKIGEMMPNSSANDLADLAAGLQVAAGEDLAKLGGDKSLLATQKMMLGGMSFERAMGIQLAATENNIDPRFGNQLADVLAATDPTAGTPQKGPLSAIEKAKKEFYKLAPEQRFMKLQTDAKLAQSIFGADGAQYMQLMGDGREQQNRLLDWQANDFVKQRQQQGRQWNRGVLAEVQAANVAQTQRADDVQGGRFATADALGSQYLSDLRDKGAPFNMRWIRSAQLWGAQVQAEAMGGDQLQATRQVIRGDNMSRFSPTPQDQSKYDALTAALQKNNQLLDKNNQIMQGRQGQKNIDAHTE